MAMQTLREQFGSNGLGYVMLKPDGNRTEVLDYLHGFMHGMDVVELCSAPIRFTYDEALAFYPKDDAWCEKYGKKRIDYLKSRQGAGYRGSDDPLMVGKQILDQMAKYLSSGDCYLYMFSYTNAPAIARNLVGATIPKDAGRESLRGRFGFSDSIEVSALENRALRNVAHAPDEDGVHAELLQIARLQHLRLDVQKIVRHSVDEFLEK